VLLLPFSADIHACYIFDKTLKAGPLTGILPGGTEKSPGPLPEKVLMFSKKGLY